MFDQSEPTVSGNTLSAKIATPAPSLFVPFHTQKQVDGSSGLRFN